MKTRFFARQAIFSRDQDVVGYELLVRDEPESDLRCDSLARATSSSTAAAFLRIGLDKITGGKPAFVGFGRESLLSGAPLLLPAKSLVVELLESVEPEAEVIKACRRLRASGYAIALDDFAGSEAWRPIVELADIVKVDTTRAADRERTARRLRRFGVKLLAERVETREELEGALAAGYDLFQGFFINQPTLDTTRASRGFERAYLRILEAVGSPSCDLRQIEDLIRRDLALTQKILRLATSSSFGRPAESVSVRHALQLLGLDEVRKWVALLVAAGLCDGAPSELIRSTLLRARFCEEVAALFGLAERATDLFLVGLFSELDTMLGRPMADILGELALAEGLAAALRGAPSVLSQPLRCAVAWERGDWITIDSLSETLRARGDGLPEAYARALAWLGESLALSA